MSFKAVAAGIAKKQGISMNRASAELAVGTRRNMAKHGISAKHGIPKDVWKGRSYKHGSGTLMGEDCLKKVGAL